MGPVKTVLYLYLSVLKVNTLKNPKPFRKFAQLGSLAIAKYLSDQPDRVHAMKQATIALEKQVGAMLTFKGKEDEAWANYMIGSQFIDLAKFVEETPMDEAITVVRAIKDSDGDFAQPVVEEYVKKVFEYLIQSVQDQVGILESVMKNAIAEAANGEDGLHEEGQDEDATIPQSTDDANPQE